jgi:AraC family transcriptional regulator
VHAPYASLQAEHVTVVLSLPAYDPLLHHIALVLQAVIEGEGVAGHLYAAALTDALVVHFLKRYAASRSPLRQATGGLVPSKLRRTIAYIQEHLEQELSLTTLAAVAQTSPAHFARLFKQATGRTPHQYVITCRMEYAKQLLVETDMPLSEIGPQVGCADQSHFTALFRKHVSMTPQVYRNTTPLVESKPFQPTPGRYISHHACMAPVPNLETCGDSVCELAISTRDRWNLASETTVAARSTS